MTPIKWVDPRELYNADKGDDGDVLVLTLDQIEAWLDTQRYARAADGLHVCVEDLLDQVQAWRTQGDTR